MIIKVNIKITYRVFFYAKDSSNIFFYLFNIKIKLNYFEKKLGLIWIKSK